MIEENLIEENLVEENLVVARLKKMLLEHLVCNQEHYQDIVKNLCSCKIYYRTPSYYPRSRGDNLGLRHPKRRVLKK